MLTNLRSHERSVYSQKGEDGVLARIFECIGPTNRRFVEFGAWDGILCSNTAHLRLDHGWSGLLMEGNPERSNEHVVHEFITRENIDALLTKYHVPATFDLLSIDIDGNEYWVWKAIQRHRARVVVIEYNIFFGNDVSVTIPYDAGHVWDQSYYHGASLAALEKLGREKGYALVHSESYSPNAFFIADEALPDAVVLGSIDEIAAWNWGNAAMPPIGPEQPSQRL